MKDNIIILPNYKMLTYLTNVIRENRAKPIINSRLKIYLPFKVDKLLYLLESLIYIDFVFYPTESVRGYKSVLDIICLSTRYLFIFLGRSKRPLLDIIKYVISILKFKNRIIHRARVDKDRVLVCSYEFNKFFI